ncbi:MAG: N-acetylglucosamine-6-phosphate deacetylase [Candidatus Saccharibacteria bacterium]|nr:N-acetylglucosamine-6-phosphate deacetylase [Pseudorhodobacter sp.]
MITHWLCPDLLFDGQTLRKGMALGVAADRISTLAPVDGLPADARRHAISGTITPGFLDLQVNGGSDVFLNTTPTVAGMAAIAAAHRRFGTVGILPTLITDAPEVLDQAAQAALDAKGQTGILGLHIEGPHISLARRGTHAARYLRPLDTRTIDIVRSLRAARIAVMITLAPEAVSQGQIAILAALGAVVSIGHSDATSEATRACLAEGATCFTHLYNAMSPMQGRAPGVTGTAINASAYCGIICDGIHVADEMVALALRARPKPDTTFLVSDAMPTVGGADHFTLYGNEIRLVDGRLINSEGSLAGAHVTMAESVRRLITVIGIDPAQALRMAVAVPARVIGADHLAVVQGRSLDDLLILDADWRMTGTCAALPV